MILTESALMKFGINQIVKHLKLEIDYKKDSKDTTYEEHFCISVKEIQVQNFSGYERAIFLLINENSTWIFHVLDVILGGVERKRTIFLVSFLHLLHR